MLNKLKRWESLLMTYYQFDQTQSCKWLVFTMGFGVTENNEMVFNYSDNGRGMSPSKTIFSDSLGMNLICMLVENQLDGKLGFFMIRVSTYHRVYYFSSAH